MLAGKMRRVLVDWMDSRRPGTEWQFLSEMKFEPAVSIASVGYIIRQSGDTLWLAQSISRDGEDLQVNGVLTIPMCAVVSVRDLYDADDVVPQ